MRFYLDRRLTIPWLCTLILVAWALVCAWTNTGQLGDNVEQYIWSRSMEWGYHKHPPLPTWMLGLVEHIFGPSKWWPMTLAAATVIAALWVTWLVTRSIANALVANIAVLVWTLLQYFSSGIQLFNHNTVMVLCVALVALSAVMTDKHKAWWLCVGVGSGLAMLAKYQSFLPLIGILAALACSGKLRSRTQLWRVTGSVLLALLIFSPHLVWLIQHDFVTLNYVSKSVDSPGGLDRIRSITSFFANQVRIAFPLILGLLVYGLSGIALSRNAPAQRQLSPVHQIQRAWTRGLFWWPMIAVLLLPLVSGITLRNHWGMQVIQFMCIPIAWALLNSQRFNLSRLVGSVLFAHIIAISFYVYTQNQFVSFASRAHRADTMYPAQEMADLAGEGWRRATKCELRYVQGDFEAGLIAMYSGAKAKVAVSPLATPWIDLNDMEKRGSLFIAKTEEEIPRDYSHAGSMHLTKHGKPTDDSGQIFIGVKAPQDICKG